MRRALSLLLALALCLTLSAGALASGEPEEAEEAATEEVAEIAEEVAEETVDGSEEPAEAVEDADDEEYVEASDESADADESQEEAAESAELEKSTWEDEEADDTLPDDSEFEPVLDGAASTNYTLTGNQCDDIVAIAYAQKNKIASDFGLSSGWCASFISWCARKANIPKSIIADSVYAYAPDFKVPYYSFTSTSPKKGDLVFIENNGSKNGGDYGWDHVGIIYKVDSSKIYTVEGNYSNKVSYCTYNKSTGKHSYDNGVYIAQIGRPKYTTGSTPTNYLDQCTFYPTHLLIQATKATTLNSMPCGADTNGSKQISVSSVGESFEVKGLYVNSYGNIWYQTTKDGKTCYIQAVNRTKIVNTYYDASVTGVGVPGNWKNGTPFWISGTVKITYSRIARLDGYILSGSTEKYHTNSGSILTTSYNLYDSDVDNGLLFSKLSNGDYTYRVTAQIKNYYAGGTDGNSVWYYTNTVTVINSPFTISSTGRTSPITSFVISFNANGGTVSTTSKTVYPEQTYGTLPTPTRNGYTFLGWYTAASGGQWVYTTNKVRLSANQTLYAHWSPATYTINYNANGGTGAPASQTKTQDVKLTLSNVTPTRSGYVFKGWATGSTATTAQYQPGGSYTTNAAAILYAVWQKNATPAPTPTPAADTARLIVSSVTARPGGTAAVTVSMRNNPGIAALSFQIGYDKTKLKLISAADGGLTGWTVGVGAGEAAVWDSDGNSSYNGGILTLTFQILDAAAGRSTQVSLTNIAAVNINEREVAFTASAGTITVSSRTPGDANGDGKVTIADVIRIRKRLAGMEATLDESAADVTGDGKVTIADVVRLRKYLAGMDVVLQ